MCSCMGHPSFPDSVLQSHVNSSQYLLLLSTPHLAAHLHHLPQYSTYSLTYSRVSYGKKAAALLDDCPTTGATLSGKIPCTFGSPRIVVWPLI